MNEERILAMIEMIHWLEHLRREEWLSEWIWEWERKKSQSWLKRFTDSNNGGINLHLTQFIHWIWEDWISDVIKRIHWPRLWFAEWKREMNVSLASVFYQIKSPSRLKRFTGSSTDSLNDRGIILGPDRNDSFIWVQFVMSRSYMLIYANVGVLQGGNCKTFSFGACVTS